MLDQLAAGSDRLTDAVRGYAATGDRRYFDAFQQELTVDRTRDKAQERLERLSLTEVELALDPPRQGQLRPAGFTGEPRDGSGCARRQRGGDLPGVRR